MESIWKVLSLIVLFLISLISFRWFWLKKLRAKNHIEKLSKIAKYHKIYTVEDAYRTLDQTRNTLNSL